MMLPLALAALAWFALRPSQGRPAPGATSDARGRWAANLASMAAPVVKAARLPLSLAVAQAALESAWGTRAPGGNLYGIKGRGPAGSVTVATREELAPGHVLKTRAAFRAYRSPAESVADWARFLGARSYAPARAMSPGGALLWTWAAGYATSSRYPFAVAAVSRSVAKRTGRPDLALHLSPRQAAVALQLAKLPAGARRKAARLMAAQGSFPT